MYRPRSSFRIRDEDDFDSEEVIADGEGIRCRMQFADSAESRTRVTDALAAHNRGAGHRPGYVADALTYGRSALNDASDDLLDRRGVSLEDAKRLRDEAYAANARRGDNAWRNSQPDENGDDDDDRDDDEEHHIVNIAEAQRQRDEAYEAMVRRGDNAWRMNPNAANAIQNQAARWRHGA
jgi:hypothetical protein